jgi:hypothetical protein
MEYFSGHSSPIQWKFWQLSLWQSAARPLRLATKRLTSITHKRVDYIFREVVLWAQRLSINLGSLGCFLVVLAVVAFCLGAEPQKLPSQSLIHRSHHPIY